MPRAATFGTADLLVEDESLQVWMTPVSVFEPMVNAGFYIVGPLPHDDMTGLKVAVWALLPDGQWHRCDFRGGGMGGGDRGHRCTHSYARPEGSEVADIAKLRVEVEFRGLTATRVLDRIDPSRTRPVRPSAAHPGVYCGERQQDHLPVGRREGGYLSRRQLTAPKAAAFALARDRLDPWASSAGYLIS
jgi:hypothetical protein